MRQRAQERKTEEMEVMELEDEGRSGEESESESEYEEYTDSEDEMEPRLKPVFIRKWVTRGSALGEDAGAGSQADAAAVVSFSSQWGGSLPPQAAGVTVAAWQGTAGKRGAIPAPTAPYQPPRDQAVGGSRSRV